MSAEIRTTSVMRGWMWKCGRSTGLWVRRFYILLRREQIDEMDGGASNVMHELCTFQTDTEFSECLSSIILEEVIKFEVGPEAGLPDHVRLQLAAARAAAAGLGQRHGSRKARAQKSNKKSMFDGLYNALATRFDTDELKEWTLLLTMNDRQIRLRPETKTAFDQWSQLLNTRVPKLRVQPMFEGWVWRRFGSYDWRQRFAILHDGVIFYFVDAEQSEKFKNVAVRMEDSMFIAAPLAEATINTENLVVSESAPIDDKIFVLELKCDDPPLDEFISLVDDSQATAWVLAVRNSRQWFESIEDDHPTRRLFGGHGGGEDDGPMLASNANPLATSENQERMAIRRSLYAKFAKSSAVDDPDALQAAFTAADADGNGELDFGELRAMFAGTFAIDTTDQEWAVLVEALDADKSGTISISEFRTWFFSNQGPRPKVASFDAPPEIDMTKVSGGGAAAASAGAKPAVVPSTIDMRKQSLLGGAGGSKAALSGSEPPMRKLSLNGKRGQ